MALTTAPTGRAAGFGFPLPRRSPLFDKWEEMIVVYQGDETFTIDLELPYPVTIQTEAGVETRSL